MRVQIDEQIVDFVQHFFDARVGPVNLVDHDDRLQLRFERFHQDVTRLRQRAFARIHQQHDAVHHLEGAFHFAAEIAVARRVDNINFRAVKTHAGDFGKNRDAAFFFQIVGIHDALNDCFVGAENAALFQHGVHKSGLAVIDVRNDSYITGVLTHSIFLYCLKIVTTLHVPLPPVVTSRRTAPDKYPPRS